MPFIILFVIYLVIIPPDFFSQNAVDNKIEKNKQKITTLQDAKKKLQWQIENFKKQRKRWKEQLNYLQQSALSLKKKAKNTQLEIKNSNKKIRIQQKQIKINQLEFADYMKSIRHQILTKQKIKKTTESSILPSINFLKNYNRNQYLLKTLVQTNTVLTNSLIDDANELRKQNIALLQKLEILRKLEQQQTETLQDLDYNKQEQEELIVRMNTKIDSGTLQLNDVDFQINQVSNLIYQLLIEQKKQKEQHVLNGCQNKKLKKPVEALLIKPFNTNGNFTEKHARGVLLKTQNNNIRAALSGKVVYSGNLKGFNLVVVIDHGATCYTVYGYLTTINVKKNQHVKQGELIGAIAPAQNTPFYFEIRKNGRPLDPNEWLEQPTWKFANG